jgi:hypothetical protein
MRLTSKTRKALIAQIKAAPHRPVILPDWAYWKGTDAAYIYVDQMPIPLMRFLYEQLIAPLDPARGLVNPPGVAARNVNPHLAVVTPTRKSRAVCPNGHDYTEADYVPGVGQRCQQCRADLLLGTPSPIDINRAKTHCPKNHVLVERPNGRRRCLECPRAATQRWRAQQNGSS